MKGGREEDFRIHAQKENETFLSVSLFNVCIHKSTGSGKRELKYFYFLRLCLLAPLREIKRGLEIRMHKCATQQKLNRIATAG